MSGIGLRATIILTGALLVAVLGNAAASSNDVATSAISEHSAPITANDLAPSACASIPLVNVVTGGGTINGTESNDLILGTDLSNAINANGGNDCVLGGSGDDVIDGGDGIDTCIGGPGSNTLNNCE